MDIKSAIKAIMNDTNTTQGQLATLCGMKNQSNVSEALKRDMKISIVVRFANAMGYEVVLQKRKPGRKSVDQIVIETGDV